MRRVLQLCGGAAVFVALGGLNVPVTGAQGIVSGITVPPISVVTAGAPAGVSVTVPGLPGAPIMPGISVGVAGTASSNKGHVTQKETSTTEPATIVVGE